MGVDLDSTVSALAYAYLHDSWNGIPLVPLMNIAAPRVLDMRGEVQLVLGECGLHTGDLLFLEDVFGQAQEDEVKLVLVDHNEVSGRWHRKYSHVKFKIVSIIDHHEDAGLFRDAVPRVVSVCGSTASLIYTRCRDSQDAAVQARLDDLTMPLLRTIIYDTVNLTWRQKPIDEQAAFELLSKAVVIARGEASIDGQSVMTELEDAIESAPESNFTTFELLYKDYKLYRHERADGSLLYYGISVLHLPFRQLIGEQHELLDAWTAQVRAFMDAEELELLLMTNSVRTKGQSAYYQQAAIFARPCYHGIVARIRDMLQANNAGLTAVAEGADFGLYDQEDLLITRKRLHPLTKAFIATEFP